jgi:hypothetical protein
LTALVVAIVMLMVEANWLLFMLHSQKVQGSNTAARPDNSFVVYRSPLWGIIIAKIASSEVLIFYHNYFLAYFPCFFEIGLWYNRTVCVSVNSSLLTFEFLYQNLRNFVYCGA